MVLVLIWKFVVVESIGDSGNVLGIYLNVVAPRSWRPEIVVSGLYFWITFVVCIGWLVARRMQQHCLLFRLDL